MNQIWRVIGKFFHVYFEKKSSHLPVWGKVLMLHWVGDTVLDEEYEPYRISTNQFHEFLGWLKKKNIVHLEKWSNTTSFYSLTIDDVPENFYQNAFPLLKEAEIPFTIFVNLSLLDTKGFITTAQLKEMSSCPLCSVGSHGVSHSEFRFFNKRQALRDLKESKEKLESLLGRSIELYAFPYGSYYACGYHNKHLVSKVYRYGFGTIGCAITNPQVLPNYYLPRINVNPAYIEELTKE